MNMSQFKYKQEGKSLNSSDSVMSCWREERKWKWRTKARVIL